MDNSIEVYTIEYLTHWLENKRWTFAKTMIRNPHFWIDNKQMSSAEFTMAQKSIEHWGVEETYWRHKYTCFYANGWKYWAIHPVINRASVNG